MKYYKITNGYVIQTYIDGKCVEQEFIAGEVDYENVNGDSIEQPEFEEQYQLLHMVQPGAE